MFVLHSPEKMVYGGRKSKREEQTPLELTSDLLVVTDHSTFLLHKNFYKTDNIDSIISNMKIYFTHLINGVSRFELKLSNHHDQGKSIAFFGFLKGELEISKHVRKRHRHAAQYPAQELPLHNGECQMSTSEIPRFVLTYYSSAI